MWLRVEPGRGIPIYVQLMEQIRMAVASGLLGPGEQLPPVRELAGRLAVNPNTVAKVYQELEREGVITTRRGKGSFVAAGSPQLKEEERKKRLILAVDRLLAEAYHLGCPPEEVMETVRAGLADRPGLEGRELEKELDQS